VDAYGSLNFNLPKPQSGTNAFRAFDNNNGFSLSWVGLDAGYEPRPVGGRVALRFGPTAEAHGASCLSSDRARCDSAVGLAPVKQAFVSYQPLPELTLDFGKFDTPVGAEVAESHENFNYTRGVLYTLGEPLFHTGLRVSYAFRPELALSLIAVNGWNNTVDNNAGKTFGLKLGYQPASTVSVAVAWIGGPEQDDQVRVPCGADSSYDPNAAACVPTPGVPAAFYRVDRGGANRLDAYRHVINAVLSFDATHQLGFVVNLDYAWEGVRRSLEVSPPIERLSWFGAMLAARYQLSEYWAVAVRGEYLADPDGAVSSIANLSLATATLTVEATPTEMLTLRLEGRTDVALTGEPDTNVFLKELRDGERSQVTTTLGVVLHTD
jgi:hypothetical protein